MADFSTIIQSPQVRAIVQDNSLERAFHDSLFPNLLFRGEVAPVKWPDNVGDTMIFSAPGLIKPNAAPLAPGVDPTPKSYSIEQWQATLNQYADTIDTHMPTSITAIVDLFLRNAHQLGLQAAQSMNRKVRDQMYNAAESGWTVCDGAQSAVTQLRVARLNGFTRARNPNLVGAGVSTVRFDFVSSSNPLEITVNSTGGDVARNVIGFIPDLPGDELGPGVLLLNSAVTVADRAYVKSIDATFVVRAGGGNSIDAIGAGDVATMADCRAAIANFRSNNVPVHPDMRFHAHIDPVSENRLYGDAEMQRLNTSLPDYYMYKQFAIGEILGTIFVRNTECPVETTVNGGETNTFEPSDPFAPEVKNASGLEMHRILFTAQGGCLEYYQDLEGLITDAGITGGVAEPRITNNGIEIFSERIQLVFRAPLNRTQDMVATTWKFIGDWPVRTDAATGSRARYKRFCEVIHS